MKFFFDSKKSFSREDIEHMSQGSMLGPEIHHTNAGKSVLTSENLSKQKGGWFHRRSTFQQLSHWFPGFGQTQKNSDKKTLSERGEMAPKIKELVVDITPRFKDEMEFQHLMVAPMSPSVALHTLSLDPKKFLAENLLLSAGGISSGIKKFFIGYRTSDYPEYKVSTSKFTLGEPSRFFAHNVKLQATTDDFNLEHIEGYRIGFGGPSILLTGTLSGCSIPITKDLEGGITIAHLQPSFAHGNGIELQKKLEKNGKFKNSQDKSFNVVLGPKQYGERANLVVLRAGDQWEIFLQCFTTDYVSWKNKITQVLSFKL